MSKFKRKRKKDKSEQRNLEKELEIISQTPEPTTALVIQPKNLDITKDLATLIIVSILVIIASYTTSDVQS